MKTADELKKELENEELLHGAKHEATARVHNQLGSLYYEQQEYSQAINEYQKAYNIAKDTLGEDNEFTIDIHYRIGKVLEAQAVTNDQLQPTKLHMQENLLMRKQYDAVKHNDSNNNSNLDNIDSTLIYNDQAEEARLSGDLDRALPLYKKSIELRRKKFGDSSPALIPVYINYAELLRNKNELDASKAVLDEAMAIAMDAYGKDHALTAEIINNLGIVYRQLGELDKSQALLMEALRLRRSLLGDLDLNVGATLNNIAELLRERQDYQEAINYHYLAIEAFEKTGGSDHPGTINAKGNLGITFRRYAKLNYDQGATLIKDTVDYLTSNDYNESHPWLVKFSNEHIINEAQKLSEQGKYQQSLEMYESLLRKKELLSQIKSPERTPQKLISNNDSKRSNQAAQDLILINKGKFTSLLGKGKLLMKRSRYIEVDKVIQECQEIPKEQIGSNENDQNILISELLLLKSENYYNKSQYNLCLEISIEVLQMKTDIYGPDSEELVNVMVVMAECYRSLANYDDSESFLNQAIKLINTALKADEQTISKPAIGHLLLYIQAIVALADLHRNKGAYTIALPLLKEALDLCHENVLEDEVIMGECYTSLAAIARIKGDYIESENYHQKAHDNRIKNYGREHIKCAATKMHLAELLLRKCDWNAAEALINEATSICTSTLQEIDLMHPILIHAMYLQGRLQFARYQFQESQNTFTKALDGVMGKLGSEHPLVSKYMYCLANTMLAQHQIEEATTMFEKTLELNREIFSEHQDHYSIIMSMFGVANIYLVKGNFIKALELLDECMKSRTDTLISIGGRYHSDIADISLKRGYALLHTGSIKESAAAFGRSGSIFYNSFQNERNFRIADALIGCATANIELGKNRDAKYQLSLCMAIRSKYLADDKDHPLIQEVLYFAADNMMRVGYFHDATEACMAMESMAKERHGEESVEAAVAYKLHAHILKERGKGIKANAMYESALKVLQPVFGDKSLHVLECKIGLARCLHLNRNLGNAERAYKDALLLVDGTVGKDNHLYVDIRNNIMTLKLFQKPTDGTRAVDTLKDSVLSFYQSKYPSGHGYIAHVNGRIGMFMNSLKKDSGGRYIRKALKMFDEMKQFPYSNDHPWVQELGGYQKASSQERLSHAIQEQALSSWCMPHFDGDQNYGIVPKQYWIDLHNNTPEVWGDLHYYGVERELSDDVLPIIADARDRSTSPDSTKRRTQRSPSRKVATPVASSNSYDNLGNADDDIDLTALLNADPSQEGAPNSANIMAAAVSLQAKLQKEAAERREMEDKLHNEEHQRKDLEELLQAEQEAKQALDKKLAAEQAERDELQRKYEESLELIKELGLKASIAGIKNDEGEDVDDIFGRPKTQQAPPDGPAADDATNTGDEKNIVSVENTAGQATSESGEEKKEEEETTKTGIDILNDPAAAAAALKTAAELEAEREAARIKEEESALALARQKSELEAACFLYDRALNLQTAGWYLKALPLFEECLRVRTNYIPDDPLTNLTRRGLATNFTLMHNWEEAEEHAGACVVHMDKLHGFENIWLVESLLVQGENMLSRGLYSDAAATLSRGSKMAARIVENDKSHNPVLGRVLVRQAYCSLLLGKISEAKALAERGSAILSKTMGINHIDTILGIHVKCEILKRCSKFKEALNLIEQTLSTRKRKYGDVHPTVAESLLQQGQSLIGVGKLQDAAAKFDLALRIRLYFFGESSLEVAEVLYEKAKYAAIYCRYAEALELHEKAFAIRKEKSWEGFPGLGDSYQGLAEICLNLSWFEKAHNHIQRAMVIRANLAPATDGAAFHPLIAETKYTQAMIYRLQGEYELAKPFLDESLEEHRTLFGKENMSYLKVQQEYAYWLQDTGDLKNADKLTKRTIKLRRQVAGLEHPAYAESLQAQASILTDMGMIDEAQVMVAEASQIYRMHFAEGDDFYLHLGVIKWKVLKAFLQLAILERQGTDEEFNNIKEEKAQNDSELVNNEQVGDEIVLPKTTTPTTEAVDGNKNEKTAESTAPDAATNVDTTANIDTAPTTANNDTFTNVNEKNQQDSSESEANINAPANAADVSPRKDENDDDNTTAQTEEEPVAPVPKQPEFHNDKYIEVYNFFKEAILLLKKLYHSNDGGLLIKFVENNAIASSDVNATVPISHDETSTTANTGAPSAVNADAESAQSTSVSAPPGDSVPQQPTDSADIHGTADSSDNVEQPVKVDQSENLDASNGLIEPHQDSSGAVSTKVTENEEPTGANNSSNDITSAENPLSVLPEVPLFNPRQLPELPFNPLITYLQGRLGSAMLLEYLAKQRFAESLTAAQREIFNSRESLDRLASKEVRLKPPGVNEMEDSYLVLQEYPSINIKHTWLLKLKKEIAGVVYTLDDMEIAANNFIQAEALRKEGKFAEADVMYEEVFLTQMASLGSVQASTSVVVAETLYAKAENSRLMGEIELSKALYNQSITIFRKQLGSDNEGVLKGITGLTSILYSQGMYDDAHSLHSNVLLMYNKICGVDSIQSVRILISLGFDLLKLGKLDLAMETAQEAVRKLNNIDEKDFEDAAQARILLSNVYMHQGNFPSARENLDKAQAILEGNVAKDNHMVINVNLSRAELFMITGRVFDAQTLIAKAFKQVLKLFGRPSNRTENGKSNERKMAFFESFDNLTLETSKVGEEETDADGRPRKARREQDELNDNDLDTEMNAAFDDVKSQFNDASSLIGADDKTTVSSYVLFVKTKPPKAALVHKGTPLAAHPVISDCITLKGRISSILGDFSDAKSMLEAALNMMNQITARITQKKASIMYELANLVALKGHFEDAKHQHNELLQQRLQICDEDHPDKADSLFQIARLNNILSKFDDSTQILTEALVIRKKVYGESHWKVAEAFVECAAVLHAKGFHADSDSLYDKSMAIFKRCFGDLHLLISSVLLGQAANARESGSFDQANAYIEQATAMRGIIIGDGHPDTARCWYEQALVSRCLGRNLETKRLLDQTIACQRDKLGKYHPYTSMTLLALAFNFMDLAKYATAGHVFNRAIQLIRKNFGKDHVLVADGLGGVAENLRYQAFYSAAKENHEKALYIRRKLLGERHHSLAESMYFLGEIFAALAQYEEAIKSFDDALALQRMAFVNQSHPDIATTMHGLANVLLAQGKIQDAKHIHERAFKIRKASLSGDHPAIGFSQFCIASVFRKMGRFEQAGALFERCQNTVRDSIGSRHPMVGTIIYNSAEVANQMGRYYQAESLLLESLGIRLAVFQEVNENHPAIVESYFGLGENLRLRGLYEFSKDKKDSIPELEKLRNEKERMHKAADAAGINHGNNAQSAINDSSESNATGDNTNKNSVDIAESILDGLDPEENNSDAAMRQHENQSIQDFPKVGKEKISEKNSVVPPPAVKESNSAGRVEQPQVYDPTADDSDLISAPTVRISAVENLDNDELDANAGGNENNSDNEGNQEEDDDGTNAVFDSRTLTEDPRKYKAIPLLNRVLDMLKETFSKEHPLIFLTQHAIAEVLKALGKYDAALEMHEAILAERKKVLGENHPDTLATMLALGETLRAMGKLYPESSAGSLEAKRARIAKQSMSLGVSLLDHFNSLVKPCAPLPEMRPYTSAAATRMSTPLVTSRGAQSSGGGKKDRPSSKGPQEAPWVFLSAKDEKEKKKKPLKIPRGFMGYEFPAEKRFIRKEDNNVARPQRTRTGDAKWLFDAAAQSVKRTFGEQTDHPLMAALMFAKGDLLKARGDYGPSLQLYEQSLVMRRKIFRGTHPVIADCINAMAEVFRIDHKYKQALPMYDKALEIRMAAYDGSHPSIAEVKNNIAMLHFSQGHFEEAQHHFEEALLLCEELLGADHPGTAVALNNLAGLLHAAEQHKQALPLYQRALTIKKQTFGEEHADVASTMNNIGLLYKSIGKYPEAQAMYEQCLVIQKKLHGEIHRDIATTLNNLAALYVLQHKRYEAKELYKDSIAMRSSLFGREHTSVASTLNNYAGLLFTIGEYESAKDSFQDALRIRRKILGEDHPAVAETLNNIALLLFKQGMLKEALPLYEKCLDIKIRSYTEMNGSVATTINNLAGVYHKLGHFDQAIKLYERAHAIRKVVLGESHPDTKAMLENIKAAERDRKKWANVVASHEIAIAKSEKSNNKPTSPPGSPITNASLSARSRSGKLEMSTDNETQQMSFDGNSI